MQNSNRIYFPNLNGLRFLSFLCVFLTHLFSTYYAFLSEHCRSFIRSIKIFSLGEIGVSFFFVLSGFLITYLLLNEQEKTKHINIFKFYMRRILRIWPLYYAVLLFGFFVFPYFKLKFSLPLNDVSEPFDCFIFLNNFHKMNHPEAGLIINILWSVGIEEQFYLVWPWFAKLKGRFTFLTLMLLVVVISILFRFLYLSIYSIDIHTFGVMGYLAIGGIVAYLSFHSSSFNLFFSKLSKLFISIFYLCSILILLFHSDIFSHNLLMICKPIILGVIFSFIILEQNFSESSLFKVGNFKSISKLGIVSYGLYCLHPIGILLSNYLFKKLDFNIQLEIQFLLMSFCALILSVILALISYQLFEKPFLKLKSKFK